MKKIIKSKLLYQVALAILVCSVLLSLAVGLVLIINSSIHITDEVQNKYYYLVNNYGNQINIRLKQTETVIHDLNINLTSQDDIENIFVDSEVKSDILAEMQRNLNNLVKTQSSTYDLFIYLQSPNRVDEIVLTSLENSKASDVREIKVLASNAIMEKNYNFRGFWLDYEDDMLLSYLQPVVINGELAGFVGARHRKYEFLWGIKNYLGFIKGDTVLYDTSYNTVVLNHQLPGRLNTDLSSLLSEIKKEPSGVVEIEDPERGEIIVAYSRLNNGWTMVIQMSDRDVYEKVYELMKLLIMFILIGSILSLIISVAVSGRITDPISGLVKEIKRIGSGDYETRVSDKYMTFNNEIGILAATVETMRFNLSRNLKDIEENTKTLESEVDQRTKELVNTNEYLEVSMAELEENRAEMVFINDELEQTLENLRGTQEQLVESRKLSAISDLVNGVAHQLNTPIGVSITAVSYLKKELNDFYKRLKIDGVMNEEIKEELTEIAETTELTMKNLSQARDILDTFKYITSDSATEKETKLELGEFLSDLTSALMVKAEYVKYKLNFMCEKEIFINSFPSVLTQIMTNLISNTVIHGFKDRNHGGINITIEEKEHFIVITYEDDGAGIPEDVIERVFDPFFTTATSRERVGLGLSIVYNYVTVKLLGRIKCESINQEGTQFIIQIPK